jgi:hypothetical protein
MHVIEDAEEIRQFPAFRFSVAPMMDGTNFGGYNADLIDDFA